MNNEQCGKANYYRLRCGDKFALLKVRLNAAKVLKSTAVGKPFQAFITRSLKKDLRVPAVCVLYNL